ncbi:MAG: efflux RND transporter permease subunit, partial [Alphaproteobacteria bacterium]
GNSAFIFGIISIFLILAALYESWRLPFVIIMAVPFAFLGALLAIFITGMENDIYFQIGLVTLIGLACKNAVLIVEFAEIKRKEGFASLEAAIRSANQRFRPIIMTSLAFIFGVLPLVFSTGAGANSRHSIGTGVVGGMIFATFIAIIFIPIFYYWLRPKEEKKGGKNES